MHKSFAFEECQAILNPIASRTLSFMSDDMGIELVSKDFDILAVTMLSPYPYMVEIGISGSINCSFIMGFEADVLRDAAAVFNDDEQQDAEDTLMYEQVAFEIANTVLGNAIANFPNHGHGIIITAPSIVAADDELLKKTNAIICSTEIEASVGSIMVAIFKEIKHGDARC